MNSLAELPSERQCHRALFKIVWGVNCCPDCNGKLLFRTNYEWCKKCRLKTSVKAVTNFKYSNLSFQQIWLIIWCWQHSKTVGDTKAIVGVSYPTINKWLAKLRQLLPKDQTTLSGVIEVDESFFGKKRFKTRSGQQLVVGAIERDTRRIKLRVIPNRERETLEQFVIDNVSTGSHINTDAWYAYGELHLLGFTHDFCNHSIGHFGPTNLIENLWSVIKRNLRHIYRNLALSNLELILNEWETRQNQPELMYNVTNYLRVAACSGLFR